MKTYIVFSGIEYRNYKNRIDTQEYARFAIEAESVEEALIKTRKSLEANPVGSLITLYRVEHTEAWEISGETITPTAPLVDQSVK